MLRTVAALCGLLAAAAAGFPAPASGQAAPATVLFEGARLIPGDGRAPIDGSAFLVQGGTIKAVGRMGELPAPRGAARIDLTGKTVMPTLINVHGHPGFQRGLTYSRDNYTRDTYLQDLNRALYYGIGVVVSQGIDPGDLALQIRAEQAAGTLGGARLLLAGRGIGAPNAGPGAAAYRGIAYEITTEEDARRSVREQAARKVDLIKIWVDDRGGRAPRLSPALSRAVIDEAHRNRLRVNAHIFYLADAKDLVEAGIDGFAHMTRDREMDDELIGAIVRRNVYVMPNVSNPERGIYAGTPKWWPSWLDGPGSLRQVVAPEVIQRMTDAFAAREPAAAARSRGQYGILQRTLARLSAAGARIVLGSDTGVDDHFFGFAEHRELEAMVDAGMTPAQVIVAATSRGAEYLGLNDVGTLAPGKRADFIVLDANPLEDIRNTRQIARIYVRGNEVDRGALRNSLQ